MECSFEAHNPYIAACPEIRLDAYMYKAVPPLQLLTSHACGMKESTLRHLAHSVARGIEYLHKSAITHRDIKPENIVISKRGSGERDVSITAPCHDYILGCKRSLRKTIKNHIGTIQ